MAKIKEQKPKNAVERLIGALEKRLKTYHRNLSIIEENYQEEKGRELQKITDAKLQLKALRRK